MASLGVTVLVCFLTLHCIGMASAERSRVSVEFAGSNHGVKGNIRIDGQTWFSFDKNTAFHTAREWYSQTSSNLFFVSSKKANGEDTYGHYNATVLSWSMSEGLKTDFTTEVRLYPKKNIVIFESKIAREGGITNTNFTGLHSNFELPVNPDGPRPFATSWVRLFPRFMAAARSFKKLDSTQATSQPVRRASSIHRCRWNLRAFWAPKRPAEHGVQYSKLCRREAGPCQGLSFWSVINAYKPPSRLLHKGCSSGGRWRNGVNWSIWSTVKWQRTPVQVASFFSLQNCRSIC